MVKIKIITPIEEPTDCISSLVVAENPMNKRNKPR